MRAIASTPASGSEPCAARPAVSTSSQTKPLCATQTLSPVGSVTIAPSARRSRATAALPMLACSSSTTAVTITSPAAGRRASAAPAHIAAARPAFMSNEPRPCMRSPSTRGSSGSAMPPAPTVSVWALRIRLRPPPVPRAVAITFGAAGRDLVDPHLEAGALQPGGHVRGDRRLSRPAGHQRGVDGVDRDQLGQQGRALGRHAADATRRGRPAQPPRSRPARGRARGRAPAGCPTARSGRRPAGSPACPGSRPGTRGSATRRRSP